MRWDIAGSISPLRHVVWGSSSLCSETDEPLYISGTSASTLVLNSGRIRRHSRNIGQLLPAVSVGKFRNTTFD